MGTDLMRYDRLVEGAMRGVMIAALGRAARDGLPGGHHFYITFRTGHPGTRLDAEIRAVHPEEMTIVLQHQYRGLEVGDTAFEVALRFNKVWRTLVVPFEAVTSFADPSVKFGLQFAPSAAAEPRVGSPAKAGGRDGAAEDIRTEAEVAAEIAGKVVALDAFRKN